YRNKCCGGTTYPPELVADGQVVCRVRHPSTVPGWLRDWAESVKFARTWLRSTAEVAIVDTRRDAVVWRTSYAMEWDDSVDVTAQGRFLIETHVAGYEHVVNVIALPLAYYSPWWPRAAGLLIAALVLV